MNFFQWLHFSQMVSTHLFAKKHIQQLIQCQDSREISSSQFQIRALITCDEQTGGVGRRGNKWQSQSGDLMATYVLTAPTSPHFHRAGHIPLSTVCALFDALASLSKNEGADIWVKWPNDLYQRQNKIAGVMAEQLQDGSITLVSLGVNLKDRKDSSMLRKSQKEIGASLDRDDQNVSPWELAKVMSEQLMHHLQLLSSGKRAALYPHYLGSGAVPGKAVDFSFSRNEKSRERGVYGGIDGAGRIKVLWQGRLLHLNAQQICKLRFAT